MKVTIEFVGGPVDGTITIDPTEADPSNDLDVFAHGFYLLTQGVVGEASMSMAPAAMEELRSKGSDRCSPITLCKYRVIERNEDDGQVFVKAEFYDE